MTYATTATTATSTPTQTPARAVLAAFAGAAVGLMLGFIVYWLSDSLATALHQSHPAGVFVLALVLAVYALAGAGIACILLPRPPTPRR